MTEFTYNEDHSEADMKHKLDEQPMCSKCLQYYNLLVERPEHYVIGDISHIRITAKTELLCRECLDDVLDKLEREGDTLHELD